MLSKQHSNHVVLLIQYNIWHIAVPATPFVAKEEYYGWVKEYTFLYCV